jgi:glycosyltransferase involved in cell wall biosynthesis
MQNFEKLLHLGVDVVGVGSQIGAYQVKNLKFPVMRLGCLGEQVAYVPGGIKTISRVLGDVNWLWGLEKVLQNCDIAHVAELANYYSWQAVAMKDKGWGGKVVVTAWETMSGLGDGNARRRELKQRVARGADKFVAMSERAARALLVEGVSESKIEIIPPGVDTKVFRPKFGKKSGESRRVLFVGRLVEEKGIWDLMQAMSGVDAELRVVAKTNYATMVGEYQQAGVVVVPSKKKNDWEEQFGMVAVEAMACGVPVVVGPALKEVVADAGMVIREGDWRYLKDTINRVLTDQRLASKLSTSGIKRVHRLFNSDLIAEKLVKVYERLN